MIYRKKSHVVTRRIAGEALLVPVHNALADLQRLFVVEDAAEFIWQAMDGRTTLDQIRDAVVSEFEVEPDEAARDLEAFVAELRKLDLIEEAVAHDVPADR